jgi:hypothetical protein
VTLAVCTLGAWTFFAQAAEATSRAAPKIRLT